MCLHKFLSQCPDCWRDIHEDHHPNNLDCPRYKEIVVVFYDFRKKEFHNEGLAHNDGDLCSNTLDLVVGGLPDNQVLLAT